MPRLLAAGRTVTALFRVAPAIKARPPDILLERATRIRQLAPTHRLKIYHLKVYRLKAYQPQIHRLKIYHLKVCRPKVYRLKIQRAPMVIRGLRTRLIREARRVFPTANSWRRPVIKIERGGL